MTFNDYIYNQDKLTVSVYENGKYVYKTYNEQIGYSEEELNDFVQNIFDAGYAKNFVTASDYGYADDDLLLMPAVKNSEVLYYNKNALLELGVEVPQTWEELWEICRLAKMRWPNCTPLGYDNAENLIFDM